VKIDVSSTAGLSHIALYRNDQPIGSDFTPPFEVVWDTQWDADGECTLLAKAAGEGFVQAVSPPTVVIVDNTPPTVTITSPKADTVLGGAVPLKAEATDAVGIAFVKFLVNGREYLTATRAPYEQSWETGRGPNGIFSIEARAFDTAGNGATSAPVSVRIANPNHPPVLGHIGAQTVAEGSPLTITVTAKDPDGERDPLSLRVSGLPPWMEFNAQQGTATGTPPPSEASLALPTKTYSGVRFEVCDPEPLCDHEDITIGVTDINRPPVLAPIGDKVIKEGESIAISLAMSDPDSDPLTCRAERLPAWLNFDAAACHVEGTADFDVASVDKPRTVYAPARFHVCDPAGLCASAAMGIAVEDVDTKPVFDPVRPQEIDEGRPLHFTVVAKDANSDIVKLAVDGLPSGATFVDRLDGSGQFEWTPRLDQGGSYTVTFKASDGELETALPVTVRVNQTSWAVSGIVKTLDADRPLPGVKIQAIFGGASVQETTTDEQGVYFMKGLRPGAYVIKPSYDVPKEFSARAARPPTVQFDPLRKEVSLGERDATDVNFIVAIRY